MRLFDDFDLHYAADFEWWINYFSYNAISNLNKRYTCNKVASHVYHLRYVEVVQDDLFSDEPGIVSSGGNSAFQAFNLCLQLGAREFYFFGLDMGGEHFFGERDAKFKSASASDYELRAARFNYAIDNYKEELKIYNCSYASNLRGIPCERFV